MASVTKVTATTTSAMLLYQAGALRLDTPLVHFFGEDFAKADERKQRMTVLNLLLHNAGLPPDPTPVSYCVPSFGCPESVIPAAQRQLTFSCQADVLAALDAQVLDREPGDKYVYSDISVSLREIMLVG